MTASDTKIPMRGIQTPTFQENVESSASSGSKYTSSLKEGALAIANTISDLIIRLINYIAESFSQPTEQQAKIAESFSQPTEQEAALNTFKINVQQNNAKGSLSENETIDFLSESETTELSAILNKFQAQNKNVRKIMTDLAKDLNKNISFQKDNERGGIDVFIAYPQGKIGTFHHHQGIVNT